VIAIVDVHYTGDRARGALVVADDWTDAAPRETRVADVPVTAPYMPGALFLRELPPILEVLRGTMPDAVVVDAYVSLGPDRPGLGARLFEALNATGAIIPIVGVAKTPFRGATATEILRGASTRPLYVTAIGMDESDAAERVRTMHGAHRIPTLIRRADELARSL
jgi:deoxyribonuclease V